MSAGVQDRIPEWDRLIRSGRGDQVQEQLSRLNVRALSRAVRAPLARLCWRSGSPLLGLRVLGPVVRPRLGLKSEATAEERAEYACCLSFLGAIWEALEIFAKVDTKVFPRVLIYEAIARARRWEYDQNISLLRRYLASGNGEPYDSLVARVNLASAFVNEGHLVQATDLIRTLLFDVAVRKNILLLGNLYEIGAESFLMQRKVKDARRLLDEAEKAIGQSRSVYDFLLRKWRGIAGILESPRSRVARAGLEAVRREARKIGHWETLRECDRYEVAATGDEALLAHLYFGTPYARFRARLEAAFFKMGAPPSEYVWRPGGKARGAAVTIDLLSGTLSSGTRIKLGRVAHRLLVTLTSDFYRLFSVGELFAPIFPGEHFLPASSPARVHRALSVLRRELRTQKIPLTVRESFGRYRLEETSACAIRISRELQAESSIDLPLALLRRAWPALEFSAEQAAGLLRQSPRTIRRLLGDAVAEGKLSRLGQRRGTRYRFG